MNALGLGLIAALCWGIHDILGRQVSQRAPLMASLLVVILAGSILQIGYMLAIGAFEPVAPRPLIYAALAGVFYLLAGVALYAAFQRGPVRLVSPIIASYPVLSIGWASLSGATVSGLQWAAVLAVILGVSVVAALSESSEEQTPSTPRTIFYAAISAVGFAGTFALGQQAASLAPDLSVSLITRIVAIVLLLGIMAAGRMPFNPGRSSIPVLFAMGAFDAVALVAVVSAGSLPDAQYASVAASMFGLLTIVLAWAFLRERMGPLQWAGCVLAFIGIGYLAL